GSTGGNSLTKTPTPANRQNGVTSLTANLVSVNGAIQTTGNDFDLAIPGSGMFVFADPQTISAASTAAGGATTSFGPVYGRAGNLREFVPTATNGGAGVTVNGVTLQSNASYLANQNGQLLLGIPVTPGTPVTVPTSASGLVPIQVSSQAPFPGQATTAATLDAVIPAVGATTVSTPINYFDANGQQRALTLTFSNPVATPGAGVTWTVTATDGTGNTVGTTAPFSFDSSGNATTTSLTINSTINGTATSFTLDTKGVQMLGNAPASTTNGQAIASNTSYTQNGLPQGTFNGVKINPDGTVVGEYTNGATKVLYQIPLALFSSPDNMQALSGQVYAPTQASGAAQLGLPGQQVSNLNVGAVEESNVDLSSEFTTMILTQQAYSSSAQVVQTADKMNVTAANLIQ
ncbi:MAG: flagellar hook-basal body complex protein, partial [Alphaproteobacteria bacterium]|nr:flagellar hook-basal body complex protein [Alphaproteobacteria bacterium]